MIVIFISIVNAKSVKLSEHPLTHVSEWPVPKFLNLHNAINAGKCSYIEYTIGIEPSFTFLETNFNSIFFLSL